MEAARAAPKQTYFDAAERDRIRRALLRYMEENRIGVPTLQRAVAEAHGIVLDRIPLKTLQRFLADTHRVNDMMVRFCRDFLRDLPDDDPLDLYGAQLAAFHATPDGGLQLALEQYTGAFEGIGQVRPQGMVALNRERDEKTVKVSDLTFTARPTAAFLRAAETVSNWRNEAEPEGTVRRAYEGVAVATATGLLVSLRNSLTGAPRTYWLTAEPEGLAGQGAEPLGPLDRDPSSAFDRVVYGPALFQSTEAKLDG